MKFTVPALAAVLACVVTTSAMPTIPAGAAPANTEPLVTTIEVDLTTDTSMPADHGPNPEAYHGLPRKEGAIRWHPGPNAPEKREAAAYHGLPTKEGAIRWHPGPNAPEKREAAAYHGLPLKEGAIRWHPGPNAPQKREADPYHGLPRKEGAIRWHPGPNNNDDGDENQKRDVVGKSMTDDEAI